MNTVSKIGSYLEEHKNEITADLIRLVKINSVRSGENEKAPFGEGCLAALKETEELYRENGISARMGKNNEYVISDFGDGEKSIGIFAHSDVVPAGGEWLYAKPFSPVLRGDYLIGRGVADNKSGIIAALYAIKAIRAMGIPIKSKISVFTGSAEETGMEDMDGFLENEKMPDVSLVPDNDFPVCYGEKGILCFDACCDLKFKQIASFSGGTAHNIVPDMAIAEIADCDGLLDELKSKADKSFTFEQKNGMIKVSARGISKHAAFPDGSVNAVYVLARLLSSCDRLFKDDRKTMALVGNLLSGNHGEPFEIAYNDSAYGKLSCICGVAKTISSSLCLSFDIRYGMSVAGEELTDKIKAILEQNSWHIENAEDSRGFILGADSALTNAVMKAYMDVTGDCNSKPYLSSGGTYARRLENAYSMGTATIPKSFPKEYGAEHQKDEALYIPGFLTGIEILAKAIINIDREL